MAPADPARPPGGFVICNLFSLVSPTPWSLYDWGRLRPNVNLKTAEAHLRALVKDPSFGPVVCMWGGLGIGPVRVRAELAERATEVVELLRWQRRSLYSFGLTKTGQPTHPARIAYATRPEPFGDEPCDRLSVAPIEAPPRPTQGSLFG